MKLPPLSRRRPRLDCERLEDRTVPSSSTVDTTLDVVNAGDGLTSLREAIIAAEADPAADTIDFAPGLAKATLDLGTFDTGLDAGEVGPSAFQIRTPITIRGSGQILTRNVAGSAFRFFFVASTGSLALENLELKNGSARGGDGINGGGGAAGLGGAIFNQGTLTIRNSLLDGNVAQGGSGASFNGQFAGGGGGLGESATGSGGGGPNGGALVGPNGGFGGGGKGGTESAGGNGGFGGGGGAGAFGGSAGSGGFGGGGGGSDFNRPGAGGFGGGGGSVGSQASPAGGGGAAGMGGALFNLGGTANIVNTTIAGNTASGGVNGFGSGRAQALGGGLFNLNGTVRVVNSTFDGNRADVGGSIYNLSHDATEGVPSQSVAAATLANSIFADSTSPTQLGRDSLPAASGDEVHNVFIVTGNVTAGSFLAHVDASAKNVTNNGGFRNENGDMEIGGLIAASRPVVNALADNGGLTKTRALASGSPALDAGANAAAVDPANAGALATDQRGGTFSRISGGTVDLGAFEFQVPNRKRPATVVLTGPGFVVVQNGAPGAPQPADPYPEFNGENRVAVGDVNRDGVLDFVFSAGDRGGPHIRVISGSDGAVLHNFFAYDQLFRGGVYVATGDINNDGFSDVVTGAGEGGGPHVRVFSGKDGTILADFFAYDPALRTGVTVAVGDVNGDGTLDIITGPGPNSGSLVKVIDGTKLGLKDPVTASIQPGAVFASFSVYGEHYVDGVFLSVGNLDGDRFADIVAGPLVRGSTSQSFVYLGSSLQKVNSFFAEDFSLRVGLRFAMADTNGDGIDELIVVAAPGGGPREIVINPITGVPIESIFFFDENSRTGFGVGAANGAALPPA